MVVIVPGRNSSVFRALHEVLWQYPDKVLLKNVRVDTYNEVDRATEVIIHLSAVQGLSTLIGRILFWDESEDVHPELQDFLHCLNPKA